VLAGDDFAGGLEDRLGDFGLELAQVAVGDGGRVLAGSGWPEMGKFSTARCVCAP
jgi:hypothetical protein